MKFLETLRALRHRARSSRVGRLAQATIDWQPLTSRAVLAIALAVLGIRLFGLPQMDLIALLVGGSILALITLAVVLSLLIRIALGKSLVVEARFDTSDPRSRRPIAAGLICKGSFIPTYFSLELRRVFAQDGVRSPIHVIKGREPEEGRRHLIDSIIVPHRGLWRLTGIECTLCDALGFSRLRWVIPADASIEASAQTVPIKPLPIVAASSRSGDQLHQTRERTGDPFDIKQYDPSDGVKRILWKTYAKTGELVVRRPEPAVIPEGEVALYLIAARQDDHVAGSVQDYIRQLLAQQITILFGTDGMFYKAELAEQLAHAAGEDLEPSVAGANPFFTMDPVEIQRAINLSALSPRAGTGADFESYLQSLRDGNRFVHHVIVFAPAGDEWPSDNRGVLPRRRMEDSLWFTRLAKTAQAHSVKLTVALVSFDLDLDARIVRVRQKAAAASEQPIDRILQVFQPSKRATLPAAAQGARELSSRIVQAGAELYMIEGYE